MSDHDEDITAEPGYDPWVAVDDALDTGACPLKAHDTERVAALDWLLAESGESRVVYLRDYDERRKDDPHRRAWRRRYMREYMRRYRQRKLAQAA